nr:histidine kinase [Bacteroidota bacterium]
MTDKVLEIYLKLLEIGKLNNFGNTETVLNTYMAGANYYLLGENDSARVYWERALAYPDENPSIEALKYRPIAQMADLYYADGKVDSAKLYKQIAIEWYSENGFLYWATDVSTSLATICFKNNEFVMAEKYFRQSEKLFKEMIDKNSWYRYDSLKYVVSYGTELYLPIPHNKMKEMMWGSGRKMYYGLYQINEANKRIEDALKYFIEYHNATDTLHKIQRSRETMELQTKYESERKDQQIETLSLENELKESRLEQNSYFLFGSVGLIIIILMFGYILIRQDKLKTNHKMILLQQKLFRSQMNPHFIFNSLTSIQGFITEKDPRTASRYLSKFAKLIRNILDSSVEEFIPLADEIATIENYLELQKVRYEGKFDYTIEVDEKIDKETISIPPMLAQPFIENSIEHGFKHKKSKGNMKIRVRLNNNLLRLEVEDDGVGREKAREILYKQNKDHKSLATAITHERIRVLNRKLKNKIQL